MAYNGYGGYYNSYPQYSNTMGYQQFQQPIIQQQMMNSQQQNNEIPFYEVHFGTIKEAEAHIVPPMKSVCFVNRGLGEIYIKSADEMGNPLLETFKKVGIEDKSAEPKQPEIDMSQFIKSTDLEKYEFVTKKDLVGINDKLAELSKKVKINEILKGGDNNGK